VIGSDDLSSLKGKVTRDSSWLPSVGRSRARFKTSKIKMTPDLMFGKLLGDRKNFGGCAILLTVQVIVGHFIHTSSQFSP